MSIMSFMKSGIRNNVITTLRPVRRDDPEATFDPFKKT